MAEHTAHANAGNISWPVKMAQYVPPPSAQALASALPVFKKRRCAHLPGTWLASKSMATVTLSSASPSGFGPSIALILQGHVHKHKFAMQFETVLQAEWFFKLVKQLISGHSGASKDIHNVDTELTDIPVSQVETLKSYCLGLNTAVVGSHGASLKTLRQEIRAKSSTLLTDVLPLSELSVNVGVRDEQGHSSAFNKKSSPLVLPPRFPSLDLQNHPFRAHTNGCEQQKGNIPTISAEGSHNEQDLKEQIKAYFLDPEFQGFVERVERIWHAMEDDVATEISLIHS